MRGKEIITKLIIPGAIAMIICLIVHPMCMNGEILDWRKLLLFVGIPFGFQKCRFLAKCLLQLIISRQEPLFQSNFLPSV